MTILQQRSTTWVPRPFGPPWLRAWLERHQHPVSFVLHMIGIPLTILPITLIFLYLLDIPVINKVPSLYNIEEWVLGLGTVAFGYAMQFLGHFIEGNDAGELILIKQWLGMNYVAISPRYREYLRDLDGMAS
jgi:hypothetical protein